MDQEFLVCFVCGALEFVVLIIHNRTILNKNNLQFRKKSFFTPFAPQMNKANTVG